MALIGTIRKNGWILILMMTLALGGFILMEIITNIQQRSSGDINTLGKVNGVEIKRSEFEDYEKLIYANSQGNTYQVRTQIWSYFVDKVLVEEEAENIGLGVSKDELIDLEFGNNLSPLIMERFRGADGQVNRATLNSIKAAIEGEEFTDPVNRAYWATQEKEIIKQRLEEKISNLVLKGVFTPAWQAEMVYKESNERLDFVYVRIPYDKVSDTEIQLTNDDYEAYLKEFPHLYDQQEESRIVSFVAAGVTPTGQDSAMAREAVSKLVEGLRAATNDSSFVTTNGGVFSDAYKKKADLPPAIADTLVKLPLGTVVGPYVDGNSWHIAKILDRKVLPDSVRARHILIQGATADSERKIDSLMALVKGGRARFDSLASQNSQDRGSAAKAGDLGWFAEGRMVPEFNNVCFYQGEQGKLYKVATQYGWHMIEITGKKFIKNESSVKAAFLSQRIEPSKATQQTAKEGILALAQSCKNLDDLTRKAAEQGLQIQNTPALKPNDFTFGSLGSGDDARTLVRWAFDEETEENVVSKEIFSFRDAEGGYFDSKYVVPVLKTIIPQGKTTIATLKATPRAEQEIRNRKKAEILKGKIQNAGDLNALAAQFETKIDTSRGSTFMSAFVQNGGNEPRVVGTAFGLAKDAVSAPIAGNSGVYVVRSIMDIPQIQMPADLTLPRRQATSTFISTVMQTQQMRNENLIFSPIKKRSDLRDNRSKFF